MTTVFFDLDGVLANFVRGALQTHRAELPIATVSWGFPAQIGFTGVDDPRFWEPLDFGFWANLEPYPDGFALLRFAETLVGATNIGLLTSPCDTAGCVEGKRAWVAKHLPEYRRRLFVGSAKELFASPRKVLVDDHDANCAKFMAAGGRCVMPPRPWNAYGHNCVEEDAFSVAQQSKILQQEVGYAS
jgi:hypothetical protein